LLHPITDPIKTVSFYNGMSIQRINREYKNQSESMLELPPKTDNWSRRLKSTVLTGM